MRPTLQRHGDVAARMRRFWDRRAKENPMWFANSSLDYRHTDPDEFWASGEHDLRATLDAVGATLRGDEVVVDIGCGMGRITRALARRAARVIAVDVSPEMVRLAREHLADLANVEVRLGTGHDLSGIDDASVDVCYSWVVFQHVPDPEVVCEYIAEMGRVLRPRGWALFQVSDLPEVHRPETWRTGRRWRRRLDRWLGREPRGCEAPEWLGSSLAPQRLAAALVDAGLEERASVGKGTQYHLVLARRTSPAPPSGYTDAKS